jgi:hypothetical protein
LQEHIIAEKQTNKRAKMISKDNNNNKPHNRYLLEIETVTGEKKISP